MKKNISNAIFSLYILILSLGAGIIVALGVFSAPVIFNASELLSFEMDRFSSGLIMTEIFVRSNIYLNFVAFVILLFEIYTYRYSANRSKIDLGLGAIAVIGIFSFTSYYTPLIVEAQKLGMEATATDSFGEIHKYAELDYKVILLALIALVFRRVFKAVKP